MAEAESFVPFQGIKNDVKGRLRCYKHDWISGFKAGFRYFHFSSLLLFFFLYLREMRFDLSLCKKKKTRILAPTTYIFFASAIPVITFGEQLERDTGTTTTTLLLLHLLLSLMLMRE